MTAERLRPQDATLWCVQADHAPLQIGALCLFEGRALRDDRGAVRMADLRRHVESRLGDRPRFRTRVRSVPLDAGIVWVDDESFDIAHHVRLAAVPPPGDEEQLRALVTQLLEVPLDPTRPLWEIWLVDGVAGDRVAVVPKVSHVMADGMAILEFALSLLDLEPGPVEPGQVEPWAPEASPSGPVLLLDEVTARAATLAGLARDLASALLRPGRLLRRSVALTRVGTSAAGLTPRIPVTAPVGNHRGFSWHRLPLDELLRVAHDEGTTLNDVVLAVVAGALARYLARGDARVDRPPRAIVPVSTHVVAGDEIENRFSLMIADLPVHVDDPVERVRVVHSQMARHKEQAQSDIGPVLFGLGGLIPPPLLRVLGPLLLAHQPFVNLAVTNLPGTREPMYLLGARMLELYPYVAVTGNIAVIVGVLSYEDALGLGVTVDADVVPDVEDLVEDIVAEARLLVDAAQAAADPIP